MKRFLVLFVSVIALGAGCSANPSVISTTSSSVSDYGTGTTEIDLSNHGLTAIPFALFAKTELQTLNLSQNGLTGAPQSQIGQLKNLTTLDLSSNALTGLPAELGQLTKLEVLNVSNNKLTGLPLELGNLTQLRVLDVSGNAYSKQDLDAIAKKLTKTEIRR